MINMGVIIINSYAVTTASGVSAPSSMTINDAGTNGEGYVEIEEDRGRGYSSLGQIQSGSSGNIGRSNYKIKAYSGHTGTAPTSYAWGSGSGNTGGWTVTSDGDINDVSITIGTTNGQNYTDFIFTPSNAAVGDELTFSVTCTGTNSGGSTDSSQFTFTKTVI